MKKQTEIEPSQVAIDVISNWWWACNKPRPVFDSEDKEHLKKLIAAAIQTERELHKEELEAQKQKNEEEWKAYWERRDMLNSIPG